MCYKQKCKVVSLNLAHPISEASSSCINVYNRRQQFHTTICYPLYCILFLLITELSSFALRMQQICKVVS